MKNTKTIMKSDIMYEDIISMIEERIDELRIDRKLNIENVKSDDKANMESIQNIADSISNEKSIDELNKLKFKIKELDNNNILYTHENMMELDTIMYKGRDNLDEVMKFLSTNIEDNTFNIKVEKYSLCPAIYVLELNGHKINPGSVLVKTNNGGVSFVPSELVDAKVFTYEER